MKSHLARGVLVARGIAAAVGFAALLSAGPASAWEYPLLPHVNGLAFFPETPTTETHTFAQLSAYYPGQCWRLIDTVFVDSAHVRVTISRSNDCTDTLSYWNHYFDLGFLAAGMHELNVHCTVLEPGQPPVEEEITVPFEVVQAPGPPPPPPYTLPLLEIIQVLPPHPLPGEPVTIRLQGFKPFTCTTIHDEAVLDQENIQASFTYAETCADTTQRWQRDFFMGSYAPGAYRVNIRLTVNHGTDSSSVQYHAALIWVRDPSVPPPIDSSVTILHAIEIDPPAPTISDRVFVRARGRMPFDCGFVQDALMDSYGHLWVTLVRGTGCEDTSRAWSASWDLGPLAAGDHALELDVRLRVNGITTSHYYPVAFRVTDPDAPPPPPPPPVDSSQAGLSPSHPNPFRDQTNFEVSLEESQVVELAVFDLLGRRVNTIHRGMLPSGKSLMAWDGRRSDGSRAPGGIYFYRLTRPGSIVNRRVVLLASP